MVSSSKLCDFLDLVDVQSEHQRSLHGHLADAFLALAREGYRDPSSALRLANLAPTEADTVLTKDKELHFSTGPGHSPLVPLPSAELREAIVSFRAALKNAVDVVMAREKVHAALDVALEEIRASENLSEDTRVEKTEGAAIEPVIKSNKDAVENVENADDGEGEWQLVR